MANTHWSLSAGTVKVFGVNALACLPLIGWVIRPTEPLMLIIFFITLIFFIVVENYLKLKVVYVLAALRYTLMGTVRSPKSNKFDF